MVLRMRWCGQVWLVMDSHTLEVRRDVKPVALDGTVSSNEVEECRYWAVIGLMVVLEQCILEL